MKIENTSNNTYENKLYSCKNFEFPFLEIKKYEENEYCLAFLNERQRTKKVRIFKNNIPQEISKLFNLDYNESIHGFLTEITRIQFSNN